MEGRRRPLVDIEGVARYLGDTPRHVKRLMDTRQIPFTRIGPRIVRFDLDAIDAWLESNSVKAQEA